MINYTKYKNKSGIYKVINKKSGKLYVGQSYDLYGRLVRHRDDLRKNRHPNEHLQNAWNKYGESKFMFEVIVVCDKKKVLEHEQMHIDFWWGTGLLYNKQKIAGRPPENKKHPVWCYDMSGKFKKEYPSVSFAAEALGIESSNYISCVCRGKGISCGGFRWSYANEKLIIRKPNLNGSGHKRVYYINKYGKKLEFKSAASAAKFRNVNVTTISNWCNGRGKEGGEWGYIGKPITEKINNRDKAVCCYGVDGVFIKKFITMTKAAEELNTDASWIAFVCKGKGDTAGGYKWAFDGEVPIVRPDGYIVGAQKRKKRIYYIDNNGNRTEFIGIKDAAQRLGVVRESVYSWIRGTRNYKYGGKWGYIKK